MEPCSPGQRSSDGRARRPPRRRRSPLPLRPPMCRPILRAGVGASRPHPRRVPGGRRGPPR
eukprot:1207638-Prymnesium_polylepis.1